MNYLALILHHSGRIGRRDYWIGFGIFMALLSLLVIALAPPLHTMDFSLFDRIETFILAALFLWTHSAVTVKRLHDLNRPWWHYLFYGLLPVLMMIMVIYPALSVIGFALWAWTKYRLGFVRGTVGPNDYGSDPLEPDLFEPA